MPLLVGVVPFGLVTGVTMVAAGLSPLAAMAMSIVVYAGATMLAAAQLLADSAPVLVLLLVAVVLNLRLVLYSASIRQHFAGLGRAERALAAYLLGDNMSRGFALVAWPARYGETGVTTFMISHDGEVFEKDIGPSTDKVASAMQTFDPDDSWNEVDGDAGGT